MRPADVIAELVQTPLRRIEDATAADGVPAHPGFYAWWVAPDALPGVLVTPHPSMPFGLLYVGVAPRSETSGARLRSRLCRQHIGGNVASSTFRFGLASLLWKQEGWTPRRSASGKYRLEADDNSALSEWQRRHLRVRWAIVDSPWLIERNVIHELKPPMNRDHNEHHAFYTAMGEARDAFRAAAVSV